MDCASAPTDYGTPKVGKLSDTGGGGGGTATSNGVDSRPPSSPPVSGSPRPGKPLTPNNNNASIAPAASSPVAGVSNNASPGPANKILGRNCNGTMVTTSAPSNEAELQLYRVMQRASLLAYYDTLLEMGGDDVQQLCEAGEQEFLEIMSLVGMASKPLHVRRLQKALQEWFTNPVQFLVPLGPSPTSFPMATRGVAVVGLPPPAVMALAPPPVPVLGAPSTSVAAVATAASSAASAASVEPPRIPSHLPPVLGAAPAFAQLASPSSPGVDCQTPDMVSTNHSSSVAPPLRQGAASPAPTTQTTSSAPSSPPARSTSPALQLTPVLLESQIARLAEAAESLARKLPAYQPRPHNAKKKMCKDLEHVINMAESDPRRMEEIRKYAAIYGRFDCKRKPEKPLTLHEVSVNEAAAQICRFVPALLTRRDELFPLARQVVRNSGYLYSKGHASVTCYRSSRSHNGDDILTAGHKRPRIDSSETVETLADQVRRQERFEQIQEELRQLAERADELAASRDSHALHAVHVRQGVLHAEHADLLSHALTPSSSRQHRRSSGRSSSLIDSERPDTDDTDSQLSLSNASSPSQEVNEWKDNDSSERISQSPGKLNRQEHAGEGIRLVQELQRNDCFFGETKVQVIASSGSNIIAVANPALSMSPALHKSPSPSATSVTSPTSPTSESGDRDRDSPPNADDDSPNHRIQPKIEPQSPPASPQKVCRRGRPPSRGLKSQPQV